MKKLIICMVLLLMHFILATARNNPSGFVVKRGTNVAHFLSQSERRGTERERFFTKNDVVRIAEMGFDHIRLPVDEEQLWDENGRRNDEAFGLMNDVIGWCLELDLRVIVDLHILRSHHFNASEKPLWTDPAEQNKFCDLWRDLSSSLKKYPLDKVAYELMNEAVADDPEAWNKLLAKATVAIREIEPERTIVIGSNRWQQGGTFDELRIPENDQNILLSFHFYEPFLLTHWGARWTGLRDYNGPVHYPGEILSSQEFEKLPFRMKVPAQRWVGRKFDKEWMREQWKKPLEKAKMLNLPLYCGEFGIIDGPDKEDMSRWYQDMIDLFEEYDIGYANWNYKSGSFGLIDDDEIRREEFIRIISGK